jgi:hypothetical protein
MLRYISRGIHAQAIGRLDQVVFMIDLFFFSKVGLYQPTLAAPMHIVY